VLPRRGGSLKEGALSKRQKGRTRLLKAPTHGALSEPLFAEIFQEDAKKGKETSSFVVLTGCCCCFGNPKNPFPTPNNSVVLGFSGLFLVLDAVWIPVLSSSRLFYWTVTLQGNLRNICFPSGF